MESNQNKLHKEFEDYCAKHPGERFWQALRNWSGLNFIFAGNQRDKLKDTFFWNSKGKTTKDFTKII